MTPETQTYIAYRLKLLLDKLQSQKYTADDLSEELSQISTLIDLAT